MVTKYCSRCGRYKLVKYFGLCRRNKDGLQSWCKECRSEYTTSSKGKAPSKESRLRHKELYPDKVKKAHAARNKKYRQTEKGKVAHSATNREYYLRFPEKIRARSAVQHALGSGKLIRPEHCSKCGKKCKPEAHHEDYSKPLEVQWLCGDTCHPAADKKKRKRGGKC